MFVWDPIVAWYSSVESKLDLVLVWGSIEFAFVWVVEMHLVEVVGVWKWHTRTPVFPTLPCYYGGPL